VLKRVVTAIDAWQRRHAAGGFVYAVIKKYGEDRGSKLAALVAFYAFFSMFPLLLAFVSILGFVLEDNPSLRDDILDSALSRLPVIGGQVADQVHPLTGSGVALAVGLIGALWAGLGVTLALSYAFAEISAVPRVERPNGFKSRLRGLLLLAALAVTLIGSTIVSGLAIGGQGVAIAIALSVNFVALLAVFAILTARRHGIRELLPGVALAAVGSFALQTAGTWYVNHTITGATAVYGTFALVIGLLSWLLLGANLLLLCAEVNEVVRWKLWPRSMTGELAPADRVAFERVAGAAQRDKRERVTVEFRE
jgi:membrane protein